jgi:hypothetical protein
MQGQKMTFWRAAHEWRATRQYWFTSSLLMTIEMSALAARSIYRCFNLVPDLGTPANDRDHCHW